MYNIHASLYLGYHPNYLVRLTALVTSTVLTSNKNPGSCSYHCVILSQLGRAFLIRTWIYLNLAIFGIRFVTAPPLYDFIRSSSYFYSSEAFSIVGDL
jgi:hypothetical protein